MAIPKVPSHMIKSAQAAHNTAHGMQATANTGAKVGDAGALFNGVAPIANTMNTLSGAAIFGAFAVNLGGLKPVKWATKKLGAHGVHENLQKFESEWNPQLSKVEQADGTLTKLGHFENAAFAASSAVSTFAVAKSFSEQLDSLKHAIADVKGVRLDQVSTMGALFGPVPASLKPAREHLIKEHAIRGVAQALGLVGMLAAVRAKKQASHMAFIAPMLVDLGLNAFMGESLLPIYAGVKNAYLDGQRTGEGLPAEAYAQFVFQASNALHARGQLGQMVAMKVGEQYAAEKTDPGVILREIDSGQFMERIKGLIAEAEAFRNAQAEAEKKKAAEAKTAGAHPGQEHAAQGNMAARVTGEKPSRPVVGQHTQMMSESNRPVVGQHTQMVSEQTPATLAVT